MNSATPFLLVDNGSLRPSAALNLRKLARSLAALTGECCLPASLLHSSKIPPEALHGEPALTWERWMKRLLTDGHRAFCVVPVFIGPTAAILEYMPQRIRALKERFGPFAIQHTPFVFPGFADDFSDLLAILRQRIEATLATLSGPPPTVALVDHGSPQAAVAQVRNFLAGALHQLLAPSVRAVIPCSMESRDGSDYAFNQPLLKSVLENPKLASGDVIVAMLFLQPGRHAGDGGDVATICANAVAHNPTLRPHRTALIATHPNFPHLLARRINAPRLNFPNA